MGHIVTAEGWEKTPSGGWKVFVSDPWTGPAGGPQPNPDTNTDPNRMTYESYDVTSLNPFRISYPGRPWVRDMIFVSPTPEPASLALLGLGGLTLLARRKRRGA